MYLNNLIEQGHRGVKLRMAWRTQLARTCNPLFCAAPHPAAGDPFDPSHQFCPTGEPIAAVMAHAGRPSVAALTSASYAAPGMAGGGGNGTQLVAVGRLGLVRC
jgi:hypothetical protein